MNTPSSPQAPPTAPAPREYHGPAVEAVITLAELEREVHYAGASASNVIID